MKRNFRLFAFLTIFSLLFPFKLNANLELPFENPEVTISMDFQDAPLKDILKILSVQSGLNFISSEGVQERKITLYLDKVLIKEAMDKIFKANNLAYELSRDSNIFIVKDLGRPQIETLTQIFYLKYATVSSSSLKEEMAANIKASEQTAGGFASGGGSSTSSTSSSSSSGSSDSSTSGKWAIEEESGITKAVKKLISEYGSVIEDFRTNSLIVTDTPRRMAVISKTIAALDIPVPQVMLEVEMLDVSKNTVDKIGFDWTGASEWSIGIEGASRMTTFPMGNRAPQDGIGGLTSVLGATQKFTPGDITFGSLELVFDFLRTQTDTKFLARPRLLTLNNETAEIRIATNEAIGVTQSSSGSGGATGEITAEAERSETGVLLRVTPQINVETGEVTMFIYPKVAQATASSITSNLGSFRDPEERSTKTLVRIRDGETVVIGGLIRDEVLNTETKLPFLGDIPFIGSLFRHKGGDNDKNQQRELLVFITPHIIKDSAVKEKYASLSKDTKPLSFPEREQANVCSFDREAVISKSLNNFDLK